MSAAEALKVARAAGIRLGIDGDSLTLEAPVAPPRQCWSCWRVTRPTSWRCCARPMTTRLAEDWHALYDERIGAAELDRGLSRARPKPTPSECCVTEWLNRNPVQSLPDRCVFCGRTNSPDAVVLPFGTAMHGHAWLHAECWPAWYRGAAAQGNDGAAGFRSHDDGAK